MEKLTGTKVSLQKAEAARRLRGAPGPVLCAVALGCWLNAGAAHALDVPPDVALEKAAELLPVTLNPPGNSLVFGTDEPCSSVQITPDDSAANMQMQAVEPGSGTNAEPEDEFFDATAPGACVPLASFAAAGEPFFAAHAAGSSFGFGATLGQMAMLVGVPAGIIKAAQALGKRRGRGGDAMPGNGPPNGGPGGPGGGPGGPGGGPGGPGGAPGGPGGTPATPTPEPASTLLLVAGAALVGRAVLKRSDRR